MRNSFENKKESKTEKLKIRKLNFNKKVEILLA